MHHSKKKKKKAWKMIYGSNIKQHLIDVKFGMSVKNIKNM